MDSTFSTYLLKSIHTCSHSYIFQTDFTFCLALFSVHHHSIFLIGFSFPSQQRWQRQQCRPEKRSVTHDVIMLPATHIWKMIIAFGLWILAYFCNIPNFRLPSTRLHPFSPFVLRVSTHAADNVTSCCKVCFQLRENVERKEKNRKSSFSFVSFSWIMWSLVKTVHKNWVTLENYFQVTHFVWLSTGTLCI